VVVRIFQELCDIFVSGINAALNFIYDYRWHLALDALKCNILRLMEAGRVQYYF
jgi:hypothetical protein